MLITRRFNFAASHICRLPEFSDEENRQFYGPESQGSGHGHNFTVEVTLRGLPDERTGIVFDLATLKKLIEEHVIKPMDHRFLNVEVPPFDRVVPTLENIAVEIWRRLQQPIAQAGGQLHRVRVYEHEDLWVDYYGE